MPEAVDSTGLENTNRTINSIPNIKSDNLNHSMINCKGCDRPILDKYLSWVSNASWHSDCVTCCECKAKLSERCFFREGKLFCRTDFFRKFGTKCSGCLQGIQPTDLVRRARSKVFHLQCFTCLVCRKTLSTGEELYVLDDHRFICKEDFLSSRHHPGLFEASPGSSRHPHDVHEEEEEEDGNFYSISSGSNSGTGNDETNAPGNFYSISPQSNSGTENDDTPVGGNFYSISSGSNSGTGNDDKAAVNDENNSTGNDNTPGGTKRRGPRTTIKAKQLEILKTAFSNTPKPTRHIRETLAAETGLNMRVIQVWFQNRRSKERRMKQLSSMGARRHFFRSRAGRSPPVHGPHPGYHPHSGVGGNGGGPPSEPPYYGDFYEGGYHHPEDHIIPVHGPSPLDGQTVIPGGEPSLPGLESAGGWPMGQM